MIRPTTSDEVLFTTSYCILQYHIMHCTALINLRHQFLSLILLCNLIRYSALQTETSLHDLPERTPQVLLFIATIILVVNLLVETVYQQLYTTNLASIYLYRAATSNARRVIGHRYGTGQLLLRINLRSDLTSGGQNKVM